MVCKMNAYLGGLQYAALT